MLLFTSFAVTESVEFFTQNFCLHALFQMFLVGITCQQEFYMDGRYHCH